MTEWYHTRCGLSSEMFGPDKTPAGPVTGVCRDVMRRWRVASCEKLQRGSGARGPGGGCEGGDGRGSAVVILEIAGSCNTASPRGAVGVSPFRFPTSNHNVPSRMNTLTFSASVVLWSHKFDKFFYITETRSILDIKDHVEYTSIKVMDAL